MTQRPNYSCAIEHLFVCVADETGWTDILGYPCILPSRYVRIACQFDGFQTASARWNRVVIEYLIGRGRRERISVS